MMMLFRYFKTEYYTLKILPRDWLPSAQEDFSGDEGAPPPYTFTYYNFQNFLLILGKVFSKGKTVWRFGTTVSNWVYTLQI